MSTNPVYLIIGGTSGIGQATAFALQAQGAQVVITGRNADKRAAMAELGFETLELEAKNSGQVNEVVEGVFARYGAVAGIVHCAGSILLKPAHLIKDEEFSATLEQNLVSAFHVLRASARLLAKQPEGGALVFCSSVAARRGLVNHEAIAAAKAGVEGLALAAAATYAKSKVRVNCVAPGLTRTDLTQGLTQNEIMLKASAAMHPLGRIGEASEVASAITWLLQNPWVTGQVIAVDGGMSHVQSSGLAPK
jgi:3-oxoacyl-[acyl-carrier protein] reductase